MARAKQFTVADYLLTRLRQLRVTEVFQIPGDYVKHFTQALEHFKGVATIGTANELEAGYAADAYGRTRGLAAVSLQYGVSTYSALNAIAGAYVERSPIVVISAAPGSDARQIGSMYGVLYHHSTGNLKADQEIFEHVTVAAETLSTNVDAPEKIDRLLVAALTHQRPVYIACYKEVWGEPCPRPPGKRLRAEVPRSAPAALRNAVDAAWGQIKMAQKPVLLAGVELLRHGLTDELQKLLEASGLLYTTTSLAKTVLAEEGDRLLGTYSDAASIPAVAQAVENADCILALGTIITDDYLWLVENKYADMILSTTEEMRVGYTTFEEVATRDLMRELTKRFKRHTKKYPLSVAAPAQPRYPEPWASNSDPKYRRSPKTITFNRFFQHTIGFLTDRKMLDDVVMTFGVSCSMYVATNAYGLAQNSYLASAAWQCIGWETGATLGAQLGSGKRTWAVAGDGGFMMVCQALSTLARNKLDSVIFVMSNGVYAIEQVFVDMSAFKPGPQHKFDAFDILPTWDYQALARGFHATAYRAKTISQLDAVLEELAKKTDRPALVEVVIPEKDLPAQMKRIGKE